MNDSKLMARPVARAQLVDELRRLGPDFARLGVTSVSLFGSRARGNHRDDSDIDLIVEISEGRKFSLLDLVAVEHVVSDRVGLPANVFLRRSLEPTFQDAVRGDEIVVFHG